MKCHVSNGETNRSEGVYSLYQTNGQWIGANRYNGEEWTDDGE